MVEDKYKVLVVDDEPRILDAIEDLLEDDFNVITSSDSEAAVEALRRERDVAVVITDQRMPKLNGDEFLNEIKKFSQATRILITGYADMTAVVRAVNNGNIFGYIAKPWNPSDFKLMVYKAVEHFELVQTLMYERNLLHNLMDHIPDWIFFKNVDLKFSRINRAQAKILGLENPEEAVGKELSDFYPEAEIGETNAEERQILRTGKPILNKVEKFKNRDGKTAWLSTTKVPIKDETGSVNGLIGISRDITTQKKTEEAIQRFFSYPLDMLCIAGYDGYFKKLNPVWMEVLGYTERELLSRPYIDFVHPDDKAITTEAAKKLAEGKIVVNFENRYRTKDGSWRWLAWKAARFVEEAQIYASVRDITVQKEAQEKIRKLNEELELRVKERTAELAAANKELEAFSYSVSHDLRAPLRHISGFVELLRDSYGEQIVPKAQHYIDAISEGAIRMGKLIDDLLSFSRAGRVAVQKTTVDMNKLIDEVLEELQSEMQGRKIELQVETLPKVPGDRNLLKMVWTNLISNALKYTGTRTKTHIEIGCRPINQQHQTAPDSADATASVKGSAAWEFFIRDNGVGFDMNYAHKLFGVFQRLHSQEEFEGMGIGLANVRRIIHRHSGQTRATGQLNKGATFYFTLPVGQK